ncbi:SepM family pheromone-processing serine protease [Pseudolactococcus insecticola]|uniref:endopeptidase La n=1 Tax=Pseudolactococcus insecticola TaxID=2709158 RepID=A0A6A0B6S9_9LACT|nr:SepM family pheromone-processing serine protease [Lactococcus insecticola]GFH40982.1 peptidase S16 [Lactococcus insecticola]
MKKNKRFINKWWLISGLVVVVLLVAVLLPLPYYVEAPGTTENVGAMVKVDHSKLKEKGSLNLTTVSMMRATGATLAYAALTNFTDVYSKADMMGDQSDSDYTRMNEFYMESAQNTAVYEAFKLAKKPFELDYQGVYVLDVSEKSTFKNILEIADTVTGVNNKSFKSSNELMAYIKSQKIGDKISVQYTDDSSQKRSATGKTIKLADGHAGIGITLVDHTSVKSTPAVKVDAGAIGGPSAGMMFTLEIYSQLVGKDLTNGQKIAGTGTIEADGTVGRIGGIDKKVATASKNGAVIFFAPDDKITKAMKKADPSIKTNYAEAKAAAEKLGTKMKIVPVKTVDDAIKYLEK